MFDGKKVLVTGGTGFVGSYVVEELTKRGAMVRVASLGARHPFEVTAEKFHGDLRILDNCLEAAKGVDFVFHLAAVGWLGKNMHHPATVLSSNLLLTANVIEASYEEGVERFLFTSSVSVYPGHLTLLKEEDAWSSHPHASESYYAWSKRIGELLCRAYFEEHGMKIAIVRLGTTYGPRDNFDPDASHVIPALIRRAVNRENPFVVWGTGKTFRSFIHARDVARGMLLALERYPVSDPVNLASDEHTKISDLVRLILELSGFKDAKIFFDRTKPEGHPHKVMSTSKALEKLGFKAEVRLRDGLEETIDWYRTFRV